MALILKNRSLRVRIEKAGEVYRGSRFDWNGTIVSARFQGIETLGQEKPFFSRNPRFFGRGLHNEFGIHTPVGYDECSVGQWFPKIGTGWLKKDDKPYFFYTRYELDPLSFTAEQVSEKEAVFTCVSGPRNGYAYEYEKKVSLEDDGFVISYRLENCGEKPIGTDEYVHNFLCIGKRPMGDGYVLSFPWVLKPERFSEINDPDGIMALEGPDVRFTRRTRKQFYLGTVSEGIREEDGLRSQWRLVHKRAAVSISEEGSFLPSKVAVWGWSSVVSPELFYSFRVESGDIVSWTRRYRFSAV